MAGSTVYFAAGTYSGIFSGSGNDINFKGQSGNPITIKPAPGAEGRVTFRQPLTLRGQYGVISGIDLNVNTSSTGISVYGDNLVIQNNKIHDSSNFRCLDVFDTASNILLANNEVYSCGMSNLSGMGEGLETTGGTNVTFSGNIIHNVIVGIEIKGGALNVVAENNLIYDVYNSAIMGSSMGCSSGPCGNTNMTNGSVPVANRYQAKNVTVRNNLIYNVSNWAPIMPKGWDTFGIYNNTIYNSSGWTTFNLAEASWEFFDSTALNTSGGSACTIYTGSSSCRKFAQPAKNGKIKNNIVHTFKSILDANSGSTSGLEMANNLYYKSGFSSSTSGAYAYGSSSYSLSGFQARGFESGSLVANPAFLSASTTSPNLKLSSSSPAIDRGASLPEVTYDYDRVPRPQGSATDIGAYEYH